MGTPTNFPYGVSAWGVPVLPDAGISPYGTVWFVDGDHGADGYSGDSPDAPYATMAKVFARVASGDTIYFRGNIREQLVTPVQVFDVTVIGASTRPRHADTTPVGGESGATWRAPASGAVVGKANVRVLQQGWRFQNILFTMEGATAAGIEIVRDAGAGNAERDASHCSIIGCRFSGAGIGIRSGVAGLFTEIAFNCEVAHCKFNSCTTAMSGINGNSWSIHHNEFQGCTSCITMALQNSLIYENILTGFTAAGSSGGIDLNGGGGLCIVTKNYLSGTYSIAGGYRVSNANDEWAGNFNTLAGGITVADPA